ncbi:MAG: DUF3298 and DUF4163 domain-containing protein [Oscillospiraceae bacterium]|jgi:hypothetical protein|nr:DUF3298 and DUF4163 domain-containing protein [Oscillospiraceae bacterium]
MYMDLQSVSVETKEIQREFFYDGVQMVRASVEYPVFSSRRFAPAVQKMNAYYLAMAARALKYAATSMRHSAIADYKYRKANGYPFNSYELDLNTVITYNHNCAVSLYNDQYEFTGGAHGNVIRTSETWNLRSGKIISLPELFPGDPRYAEQIKREIKRQIAAQMQTGEGAYFENYDELVEQTFNEEQFFLSNGALVIYFQQYDIAPYSSGLPEFQIPLNAIPAMRMPSCR